MSAVCHARTTGVNQMVCSNPDPHRPGYGCLFIGTYVPDAHDATEGDWS